LESGNARSVFPLTAVSASKISFEISGNVFVDEAPKLKALVLGGGKKCQPFSKNVRHFLRFQTPGSLIEQN
jgi:hypothetical protein